MCKNINHRFVIFLSLLISSLIIIIIKSTLTLFSLTHSRFKERSNSRELIKNRSWISTYHKYCTKIFSLNSFWNWDDSFSWFLRDDSLLPSENLRLSDKSPKRWKLLKKKWVSKNSSQVKFWYEGHFKSNFSICTVTILYLFLNIPVCLQLFKIMT